MIKFVSTILFGCCISVSPIAAQDQSPEDFYSNSDLTLMIGYTPGGGYDTYGRLLARYIGEHLPGNPEVIVENMPGAGSLTLANYIANVAPRDGSVIGVIDRTLITLPLLDPEAARYEIDSFNWIGSIASEAYVCVAWHESGFDSFSQIIEGDDEFILGATSPQTESTPRLLANLLGGNIRIVSGYPGNAEIGIAMEQGEVDGQCGSWSGIAARGEWIENDQISVLLQMGAQPAPGLEDVPLVYDFTDTQEERQIVELAITSRLELARPVIAPPQIPEERLQALLDAFEAATRDPELVAEAERQQLELSPISGSAMLELINSIYSAPPEVVQRARDAIAVNN